MAEPLSILGAVSASVHLVEKISEVYSSIRNTPQEAADLLNEAMLIGHSIRSLSDHLQRENARGNSAFTETSVLFFAVNGCHDQLETLHTALGAVGSGSRRSQILHRLEWPLQRKDALNAVKALHRYAQIFHFAVNMDGMSTLSQSHNETLAQIQARLNDIDRQQGSLAHISDSIREVRDAIVYFSPVAPAANENFALLTEIRKEEAFFKLLNSLTPLPVRKRHRDLQIRRMEGAGQWFLEKPEYLLWRNGPGQNANVIWCNGQPGAGKTYLVSLVIDHLESRQTQDQTRVLYFYYDYRQQSEQTPLRVIRTLLHQILSTQNKIPGSIEKLQQQLTTDQYAPSWSDIKSALLTLCNEGPGQVYIVIDALDECEEGTNRDQILELLRELMSSHARVLVTSRPFPPDIEDLFSQYIRVVVEASPLDIRSFVLTKIAKCTRMRNFIGSDLGARIATTIERKSGGMFLLPALQISSVLGQTTRRQILAALDALPTKLSDALDATLERIETQCSDSNSRAELALNVLMWLSTAREPLTPTQLQHAIAISSEHGSPQMDDLTDPAFFVECCFGLVTIDNEKSVIRLVHQSVHEYLQARKNAVFPTADSILACSCISYIRMAARMSEASDFRSPKFRSIFHAAPFLEYSCHAWGHHAAVGFDQSVDQAIDELLKSRKETKFWLELMKSEAATHHWGECPLSLNRESEGVCVAAGVSKLHLAAIYGILPLADKSLAGSAGDANPPLVDSLLTPLMMAARQGRFLMFDLLFAHCSDTEVNATDSEGCTALVHAAKMSHLEIIRRILTSGRQVDVNTGSPLFWAMNQACEWERAIGPVTGLIEATREVLGLFLAHPDFDPHQGPRDEKPWWAHAATLWLHEAINDLFANPNFDPGWWTSFAEATPKLVAELLRLGLDDAEGDDTQHQCDAFAMALLLDSDKRFATPAHMVLQVLWPAVYYAFTDVNAWDFDFYLDGMSIMDCREGSRNDLQSTLKSFFTERGISWDFIEANGDGFLHYLAGSEYSPRMNVLISHGANVNRANKRGQTALFRACLSGTDVEVIILLDAGADPCIQDADGWTALHEAVARCNHDAVMSLMKHGASLDVSTKSGDTPLDVVRKLLDAADMLLEIQKKGKILLDTGADPCIQDANGWTALHELVACFNRRDAVISLIKHGARFDISTKPGDTLLDVARKLLEMLKK